MSNLSPDSMVPHSSVIDKTSIVVAFLITAGLAALYFVCTGIVTNWPDSLFYADRARQLLGDGRLALSAETTLSYPPLYSLLMALSFSVGAFFVPGFLISHQILVCLQIALLCSTFFPIRRLLLGCDGIGKNEATVLSVIIALSPTALPYANMLSAEALLIPLFVWFTYFYDKFLSTNKACAAAWAGALLGLMLITKDIAWAVYVAVLLNTLLVIIKKQPVKQVLSLQIAPLLGVIIWLAYNTLILAQPLELPAFEINNGLARLNFFKNGLIYLFYGGLPLAGLVFFLSFFTKKTSHWGNAFYRFTFFTLVGTLLYTVFTTIIVVETRLDYITNRNIEPFILLPLIAFLRIPLQSRKELSANGVLIFFCLMLFGFPYALKTDFSAGISYWAQSLGNPNLGMLRNVIYILLICLPIIIMWWRPKSFILAYAIVAAIINFGNITQDSAIWGSNPDANFKFVKIEGFTTPDIQNASAVYVENQCNMMQSKDATYLYRCNDLSKLLYFIPRPLKPMRAADLSTLSLNEGEFVLFASSEIDNVIGKSIAEMGLSNIMRIEKADIDAMQRTPLVKIKTMEKLGKYINVPVQDKLQRLTLVGPDVTLALQSNKAGCAEMHIKMSYAASEENGAQKRVDFTLNKKLIKQAVFRAPIIGGTQPDFILPLMLVEGENTLQLKYDSPNKQTVMLQSNMILFGLPQFTPCQKSP